MRKRREERRRSFRAHLGLRAQAFPAYDLGEERVDGQTTEWRERLGRKQRTLRGDTRHVVAVAFTARDIFAVGDGAAVVGGVGSTPRISHRGNRIGYHASRECYSDRARGRSEGDVCGKPSGSVHLNGGCGEGRVGMVVWLDSELAVAWHGELERE